MKNFIETIINLFAYKPNNTKKFELLEDRDGFNPDDNKEDINKPGTTDTTSDTGETAGTKKNAVTVKEWNDSKAEKHNKQRDVDLNKVARDLDTNIKIMEIRFNLPKNQDIVLREFNLGRRIRACLIYVDGAVDRKIINQFILSPLMKYGYYEEIENCIVDYITANILTISRIKKSRDFNSISLETLSGFTALFIDGCDECLLIESKGFEKRSVDKPVTENVVRGSQEAFSESLSTNLSLIRRIIKNEKLIAEIIPVGKTNNSSCAVMYIDGIANSDLLEEVRRRLRQIDVDFVNGDGMIEQLIEDNPYALFPQVINTERPDRAASFIAEGQVVIASEGAPFVSAVPVTFFRLFHTSEDSNLRWGYGTFLRFIRLFGMLASFLIPGLYVALTLYHQEMLPSELLVSIIKAREQVPFPVVMEVLLMELSFELIREGGIRVPGVIGQTLGIIGALILGQAAVAAGLVSPILIIIVAITGLGSFAVPNYSLSMAVRILRFIIIIFGAVAGFYGITIAILIIAGLACNMKSFGVPFFTPVAPRTKVNPDVIVRQPIYKQKNRPDGLNTSDRKRVGDSPSWWAGKMKDGDNE